MKVKELVAELNKLDPSGELYVSGLEYVDRLPGYYDGAGFQVQDNQLKISDKEDKICLYTMNILDAVAREVSIELDLYDSRRQRYLDEIDRCINVMKNINGE